MTTRKVSYMIVRYYADFDHPNNKDVIERGLTLQEAQAHCQREDTHELDPETGDVIWFDGYTEDTLEGEVLGQQVEAHRGATHLDHLVGRLKDWKLE